MKRLSLQAIPDWVEFDKVELFRLTCFETPSGRRKTRPRSVLRGARRWADQPNAIKN